MIRQFSNTLNVKTWGDDILTFYNMEIVILIFYKDNNLYAKQLEKFRHLKKNR